MSDGAVAQLGEHLLCKQGVNGSIPFSSTTLKKDFTRIDLLQVEPPRHGTEVEP